MKRQRSERGNFEATTDVESLMLSALADAERWERLIASPGYAGETANKPARRAKAKRTSGRTVSMAERLAFAPAHARLDPGITAERTEYRTVKGMAIAKCLKCGELLRRHLDTERPCPFCRNTYFEWESRSTDVYLGDDYSLPAHWYGDLTGVSAHYIAVERSADHVPVGHGTGREKRSGQVYRVAIAPDGTETRTLVGGKRGRKGKAVVAYFAPVSEAETLFYDGTSSHVENQRI